MKHTMFLLLVTMGACGTPAAESPSAPDEGASAQEEIAESPHEEGSPIAQAEAAPRPEEVDCASPPNRPRCPPGEHATDDCNRAWEQVRAWERACGPEAAAAPAANVDCAQPEPDHPRCPPSGLGSSPECQRAWEPAQAWRRACRPT